MPSWICDLECHIPIIIGTFVNLPAAVSLEGKSAINLPSTTGCHGQMLDGRGAFAPTAFTTVDRSPISTSWTHLNTFEVPLHLFQVSYLLCSRTATYPTPATTSSQAAWYGGQSAIGVGSVSAGLPLSRIAPRNRS